MTQPTQELPYWLSASTSFGTTDGVVFTTTVVVNLPLTYYGPSIPLGDGWVYGGLTSPPPGVTTTLTATSAASESTESSSSASIPTSSALSTSSIASDSSASLSSASESSASVASASSVSASVASAISILSTQSVASTSSIAAASSLTPTQSLSSITPSAPSSTLNKSLTPSTTPSAVPPSNNGSRGLSRGSVIAISIVSAVVGLFLLLCCLLCLLWYRRRQRPNGGRPLRGNIDALPPSPIEEHGERGSLLAGRRNGGESPELGDMEEDLAGLPVAQRFMTPKRASSQFGPSGSGAAYHAVGSTSAGAAAGVAGGIAADALHHSKSSKSGSQSNASGGSGGTVSSSGIFYRPSSSNPGHLPEPTPEQPEEGEVLTAQRGARGPFARLARLSWFTSNRNTLGTSMAATAHSSAAGQDDDDDGWVTVPSSPHGGRDVATPLLGRTPRGTFTPQPRTMTRLDVPYTPSPPVSPPPVSYLRQREGLRESQQTMQSGNTVFFDAPESPPPPTADPTTIASPPPAVHVDSANEGSPALPSAAEFPTPPVGVQAYPRPISASSIGSRSIYSSQEGSDVLDSPVPAAYSRTSVGSPTRYSSGGTTGLLKPMASLTSSVGEMKRQSAPDLHSRGLSTLDEDPPTAAESWKRRLSPREASEMSQALGSKRLTLGPASFMDTPRIVDHPEVLSTHGDISLMGTVPSHSAGSSYSTHGQQSSLSSGGHSASARPRPTSGPRVPSLSAIGMGGQPLSLHQTLSSADDGSTGDRPSPEGAGLPAPPGVQMSELGELKPIPEGPSPPRRGPPGLTINPSRDIILDQETPPPPPSAHPTSQDLAPPPKSRWAPRWQ